MNPHSLKPSLGPIRQPLARSPRRHAWRLAVTAGLLCAAPAPAQSGGGYELKNSAFTGGSGSATNGAYRLAGAFGPPKTGVTANGAYSLEGQFPGILVVRMPGAPRLRLTRSGAGFVLSWPNPTTGFKLQSTTSLTTPDWADVPLPVLVAGGENTVTLPPAGGGMSCFRLVKP